MSDMDVGNRAAIVRLRKTTAQSYDCGSVNAWFISVNQGVSPSVQADNPVVSPYILSSQDNRTTGTDNQAVSLSVVAFFPIFPMSKTFPQCLPSAEEAWRPPIFRETFCDEVPESPFGQ